jgi:hypothetical protein
MSSQGSVQDAVALIKSGRRDEARAILTSILKDDKDNLAAWAGMVQVANNREEAAACLKQVLRLKPGDPWATRQLEKLEPAPPSPPPPPSPPAHAAPAPTPAPPAPHPAPTPQESEDLMARTTPSPRATLADSEGWMDASDSTPVSAADATARLEPEPLQRLSKTADEPAPAPPAEKPARGRSNTLLYVGIGVLVLALCVIVAGVAWTLMGGMQSVDALLSGGGAGGNVVYDGGDGYNTTLVETIPLGQTQQSRLDDLFDAHNWQFEGTAGQSVTIRVDGVGDSDPQAKLIDPAGRVIAEDDDGGGGYNALIVTSLPSDGTYTVRIDMWTTGPYSIIVE